MKRALQFAACLFYLAKGVANGQAIDNTLSFKNINSDRYLRINYENDFFSATDEYYTQGMHLGFVAPSIKRFPLCRLLLRPMNGVTRYAVALEHDGYTPTSISSDTILRGDRPFTACLFLKTAVLIVDTMTRERFSSAIVTGVMGPAVGGREMQVGIHNALHNITPHGWQYQLHNDVILNYQVTYEKQLIRLNKYFSLDIDALARAGTLNDKAGGGVTLIGGYFDSPFGNSAANWRHLRAYAYEHAEVNFVAFDATLQGGVFNHTSPYTIGASDITRITFGNRFGFVVSYGNLYLEYFQSFLSNEFRTGNYHVWGGIQIAFGI